MKHIPLKKPLAFALMALSACGYALDDGTQINNPIRVNYAGYLLQAEKIAIYVAPNTGAKKWRLVGTDCKGTTKDYVVNDKSSGESFYRVDFSACTQPVKNTQLTLDKHSSAPFDIAENPYGPVQYTYLKYFKDHETTTTFNQSIHDWEKGLSITFSYVRDAGDNGAYPVNTSEAVWSLINLLEVYPAANTFYSKNLIGNRTVYDQLRVLSEQFHFAMNNSRQLAVPKFHATVNTSYAKCPPYTSGTCISEPETKATYSVARALAGMSRLHSLYGTPEEATQAYTTAKTALANARKQPNVCNQADKFGGEGGYYPDNDNHATIRNPKKNGDNCFPGKDNTQDDEYSALVELYLAAEHFKNSADAASFKQEVLKHPRFNETSSFWWGAVATEGSLSLLAHEGRHSLDLAPLKTKLVEAAKTIQRNQALGYPGVTWDPNSTQWNNGDQDDKDNNVRWGSNRNALNDARILMAAANISKSQGQTAQAAQFGRSAVKVLDYLMGVNPNNIAMMTTGPYKYLENAIERTHDAMDPKDAWPGKLVNGPNNWTNCNDKDMPEFNSKPPLKMFALTGAGWASREITIDANAALVPVAYYAAEVAPGLFAQSPVGKK